MTSGNGDLSCPKYAVASFSSPVSFISTSSSMNAISPRLTASVGLKRYAFVVSSYFGSSPLTFHFIIVRTSSLNEWLRTSAGVNSAFILSICDCTGMRPANSLSSFISSISKAARSALVTESFTAICLPTSPTVMPAIARTILSTRLCALSAFSFHLPSLFILRTSANLSLAF